MGQGSAVSCPSGVWGKGQAANAFWCILSAKIAPGSNIFFTNALRKNSCIDKKCLNGVLAFKKVAECRSGAFQLNLSADTHLVN